MLKITADASGAKELAGDLRRLLADSGANVSQGKIDTVVAQLLGLSSREELEEATANGNYVHLGESLGDVATTNEFMQEVFKAIAAIAFHRFPLEEFVDNRHGDPWELPFALMRNDDGKLTLFCAPKFGDDEEDSPPALIARSESVSNLALYYAITILEAAMDDPEILEAYDDIEIEIDDDTNELTLINNALECPHCLANEAFAEYAEEHGLPPTDDIDRVRELGHIILFKPYASRNDVYALHRCDEAVYPAVWKDEIFTDFNEGHLTVGTKVWMVEGLVKGAEFADSPESGIITGFEALEGERVAVVRTKVGEGVVPVAQLIPRVGLVHPMPKHQH